jgi:hypothetical protein
VIFLNLPEGWALTYYAQSAFVLSVMGSYALMIMPVFSCIEDFVWFKNIKIGEMTSENIVSGSRIAYVLLTLYVSAKCNSLTLILQLSGSFNGLFL